MNMLAVLIYNLCLIAGCAYLVAWRDWSAWWFLLVVVFSASIETKADKS